MFSGITSFLDSFGISRHGRRRGLSIFSRRPRWTTRRRDWPGTSQGLVTLSGIEPLEVKRVFAVDVDLVGTVLTVAFDDAAADVLTLSINATGYVATGANTSVGSGPITELVVIDAGTANTSSFTLLDASQTLTDGLSIDQNITAANIATPIDAGSGNVTIHAASLTLGGNVSSGPQVYSGNVTLTGDVTLTSTGSPVPDYTNLTILTSVATGGEDSYNEDLLLSLDGRYAYASAQDYGLRVFDLADPIIPVQVANLTVSGVEPDEMALSPDGNFIYATSYGDVDFVVFNIADPTNPTVAGVSNGALGFTYTDVAVSPDGDTVYAPILSLQQDYYVELIDVSDPATPTSFANVALPADMGRPDGIALSADGNYGFVAMHTGLAVLDLDGLSVVGSLETGGSGDSITLSASGHYAYMTVRYGNSGSELQVIDVSNVAQPTLLGTVAGPFGTVELTRDGSYAFTESSDPGPVLDPMLVVDVANPLSPVIAGSLLPPEDSSWTAISLSEDLVYATSYHTLDVVGIGTAIAPGSIRFQGTIDGPHALTINDGTGGTTLLGGMVGGTTPLASLTTDANGTTTLAANVTTAGNQTYGDVVNLTAATTLVGDTGGFAAGVTGNDNDLTLNFAGTAAIDGNFTGIANLTSLGDATLCGNITTSGEQTYAGQVILLCDVTLTSTGSSGWVYDYANPTNVAVLDTPGSAFAVVLSADERQAFVSDWVAGLTIANVADPVNPGVISTTDTGCGTALQTALSADNQYAFVADGANSRGLQIINVADVANPTLAGSAFTGGPEVRAVALSTDESRAFLGLGVNTTFLFNSYNVSNVSNPTIAGASCLTGFGEDIALSADGQYAFIASDKAGLTVMNVASGSPSLVSVTDTPGRAFGATLSPDGNYVAVADFTAGVQIFDISNPAAPTIVGSYDTPDRALKTAFTTDGRYLFVADMLYGGLQILDVSDMTNPTFVGNLATPDDTMDVAITADGKYAFLAMKEVGLMTVALGSEQSGASGITFGSTVDGPHSLTANANITTFSGEVGGTTPLASLTTDANGTTTLAANVTTAGNQTYGDVVNLTATTTLAGDIGTFAAGVTGNENDLAVNFTGTAAIDSSFTGIANLTSLGTATLCGNITTSGAQDYQGAVELLCDTTLTSGSNLSAGAVTFGSTVDGGYSLTVNDIGDGLTAFTGEVGGTTPLTSLSTNANGTATLAANVTVTGPITFGDNVSLTNDVTVSSEASSTFTPDYANAAIVGNVATPDWAYSVAISPDGTLAYVADDNAGLIIMNVADATNPFEITTYSTATSALWVALSPDGTLAYVTGNNLFLVLDVSDSSSPQLVGSYALDGYGQEIAMSADGQHAFVALTGGSSQGGLLILDVTDPAAIMVESLSYTNVATWSIALTDDDRYAFVVSYGASGTLAIVDVSTVSSPSLVGSYSGLAFPDSVTLSPDGRYAYVAENTGIGIIDVIDRESPTLAGRYTASESTTDSIPSADGRYLYVSEGYSGVTILDLGNIASPSVVTTVDTPRNPWKLALAPTQQYLYSADAYYGLQIIQLGTVTEQNGSVTFGGTVDGNHVLTVNDGANGTTAFASAIGGTTPLASLKMDAGGTTTLAANVTSTGNQTYAGPVSLTANVSLVSGTGTISTADVTDGGEGYGLTVGNAAQIGAVVFGGNLSLDSLSAAAGGFDVSLSGANNTLGIASFTNTGNLALGASATSRTLASGGLTAESVAKTFLAGSVVTESGLITLNATSLTANATLDSTNAGAANGAAITLANGTLLNGFTLQTYGGQSDTEVTGDTVVSDGELVVETGSLNLGTPSQPGTLTATQDTLIQVANGALNVYAGSSIAAGNNALTIQIDDLNVAPGAGTIAAGAITVRPSTAGRTIFLGDATGSGLVVNQNAFDSFQTPVITIGTGGYNGTVNAGNLSVPEGRLDIIANGTGGAVRFDGDFVSNATNLPEGIAVFVQGSGGTTTINGSLTSAGDVVIDDAVVVASGSHAINTSGTNANITITGGTDGIYAASGETNSLTLTAGTGTVILGNQTGFGNNSGTGSMLEDVTISAGSTLLGNASSEINGTFSVLTGTLALSGNLTAGGIDVASTAGTTLTGNAALAASGNIAFAGSIDGPFALSVASNATSIFAAGLGDGAALSAVTMTGGTTRLGGDVTTTGNQSYATDLVLDGPTVLTGAAGSLAGGLDGNGNSLVLDFANETAIGAGGSLSNLAELTSIGDVATNGTISTTGEQIYLGGVSLSGATTLVASDLTLAGGVTGNNQDLTLDIAATMPINSSLAGIGNLTSLGNVTLDGAITTSGAQNYTAATTLLADVQITANGTSTPGSLSLSQVGGYPAELMLQSPGVTLSSDGRYAFVAAGVGGLEILDLATPASPSLAGNVALAGFVVDVALSSDGAYAFVSSFSSGLWVVDISDINNPSPVGSFASTNAKAVATAPGGSYVYLAAQADGLQVVDVSNPATPSLVTSVAVGDMAEDVAVLGSVAYVADRSAGLSLFDVTDPANPAPASNLVLPGASYFVAVAPDGRHAFLSTSSDGLQIADVADPTAPSVAGSFNTPDAYGVAVSADSRYVFLTAYYDGLKVVDVSDPASPSLAAESNLSLVPPAAAIGVAVSGPGAGEYAYVVGAYAGLQVVGISSAAPTGPGSVNFGGPVDGRHALTIDAGSGRAVFFGALGSGAALESLTIAAAAGVDALSTLAIDGTGGTGAGLLVADGVNNVNITQPGSTITGTGLSGILLAGNTTGSTIGGFTITNSGSHGIEAAGGDYTGTTIENSSVTASIGDGFYAANATGLTATLLHSADNAKAGIRVAGTSSNVTISNSLVGLDANGTAAQPNLGQGIVVSAATGTTLQGNTISGNGFYGIVVTGSAANTTISTNLIGVGTDGTTAIANGQSGVFVLGGATGTTIVGNRISNNSGMAGIQVVDGTSNTTIGGSGPSANLLVNNGLFGITVSGNVPGSRVLGNLVSSHTTANLYLNNAQNLTVGSATAGEENTFDTADYGVYAGGDLTGTTIQGNTFQQHTLGGVVLTEAGNLTVRDNTLDDNGAYGIYGTGELAGTTLQGNTISNHTVGVLVDNGANLTIGSATGTATGDADANVITKNTSAGVVVNGAGSQNVSILSNSIFENDFIGISLSAGGNALARTPRLATATTTDVTGSITGTDGDIYRIQYFRSSDEVTSSSRFAQGEELLGYEDVTIVGGTAALAFDLSSSSVIVTDWITATATLLVGGLPSETSQFSFGIRVTA